MAAAEVVAAEREAEGDTLRWVPEEEVVADSVGERVGEEGALRVAGASPGAAGDNR